MNRREILQMTGAGAVATAASALSARAEDAGAPQLGVRLYEYADPAELEKIAAMPPWTKRKEFKIVNWHTALARPVEDIFNELSVAGYSYVECTYADGVRAQYVFARSVPREGLEVAVRNGVLSVNQVRQLEAKS